MCAYFAQASVVAELTTILQFLTKLRLQNYMGPISTTYPVD